MWTGSGSVLPSPPDALKAPTNDPFTVLGPPPPTSYPTLVKVKNVCTVSCFSFKSFENFISNSIIFRLSPATKLIISKSPRLTHPEDSIILFPVLPALSQAEE